MKRFKGIPWRRRSLDWQAAGSLPTASGTGRFQKLDVVAWHSSSSLIPFRSRSVLPSHRVDVHDTTLRISNPSTLPSTLCDTHIHHEHGIPYEPVFSDRPPFSPAGQVRGGPAVRPAVLLPQRRQGRLLWRQARELLSPVESAAAHDSSTCAHVLPCSTKPRQRPRRLNR